MRDRRLGLLIGLAAAVLAAVGCGGGEPAADLPRLVGTVGAADDPDAFEIRLTTADGTEVTTVLAPGEYLLELRDLSTIHNFHLRPRQTGVDVATTVAGTGERTTTITVQEPEAYIYACDAHPARMHLTFSIHDRIRTQN